VDLKTEYENLYRHWLNEFEQIELTPLSPKLYNSYINLKRAINDVDKHGNNILNNQLVESYQNNINYLLSDFLKMREIKIINTAFALQEINLNNIIESEKLFFMNLVSAIKGFKKVQTLIRYEEMEFSKVDSSEAEQDVEAFINELVTPKIDPLKEHSPPKQSPQIPLKQDDQEVQYLLIRFLKDTPPLVGIDLLNYGPFEKEDLANLPLKNAHILIFEKFAEKIDF